MTAYRKKQKFTLVEIGAFDARRGYKRCILPGVALEVPTDSAFWWLPPTRLNADFWRSSDGVLVVRFSSNYPYVFHFEALLANGKPVPDKDIEDFGEYILAILDDWGGTDDPPDPKSDF
jgi:hypothetical protein